MLKIVKKNFEQEFCTLCRDDTFLDDRGRLHIVLSNNVRDGDGDSCNTYCFSDNNVYYFNAHDAVTLVNVTLTYE